MDFLIRRNDAAIRKEINGIRDSYHHYWDLLAELLQNSRDAITRKRNAGNQGPFFISVTIDAASNSIEVLDNGSGISPSLLTEILAPGGGDKGLSAATSGEVGEKGVGLTYVVFSCNNFSVVTKAAEGEVTGGRVLDAQRWLNGDSGVTRPTFEVGISDAPTESTFAKEQKTYALDTFTKIKAGAVLPPDGDVNLFRMTRQQLRLLLRTRTAVGVTRPLFSETSEDEFDVYLSVNGPSGFETEKVEARTIAPHHLVPPSARVTLQAARNAFVTRGDTASRRRFLTGKTVWATTVERVGDWDVNVYGVMFPDNDALQTLSRDVMGVPVSEQDHADGSALLQNGIFVGTKGMPTGMKLAPKPGAGRYPAYYKRCYFFVESPHLKFDLGRKSLHYRHTSRLQSAVALLFASFEDIAPYQGEARVEPGTVQVTPAERRVAIQEVWAEADSLPDLNDGSLRYQKHPNAQEAAVAAIFHELVGAGVLPSYRTLRTGYGERYDIHARYVSGGKNLPITIELKYALESLVRDLAEKQKHFGDIDLLVAWDADVRKLAAAQFLLDSEPNPHFEGVTHVLQVPVLGIDPIPVILLRTLLDRRNANLA